MYFNYKNIKKDYHSAQELSQLSVDEILSIVGQIEVLKYENDHNLDLKENDYFQWATNNNHLICDLDAARRALKLKGHEGIFIRSYFGKWKNVDRETATRFVKSMLDTSLQSRDKMIKIINEKHLVGTTVEELLKGEKYEDA